jgi:hypothetical protein
MQPYMKLFVIYLTNGYRSLLCATIQWFGLTFATVKLTHLLLPPCSMTNINLDVRLSALELIKLVIVHLPEFLPTFYIEVCTWPVHDQPFDCPDPP